MIYTYIYILYIYIYIYVCMYVCMIGHQQQVCLFVINFTNLYVNIFSFYVFLNIHYLFTIY